MKDYTFNKEGRNEIILSYEIKDGEMFIKYASGKVYKTLYTRELEKDILRKMKAQVVNVDFEKLQSSNFKKNVISYIIWLVLCFVSYNLLSVTVVEYFILNFISFSFIYYVPSIIRENKLRDCKKNKKFVENMELFQEGIKQDMGMYTNLNRKTKKTINSILEKKEEQKDTLKEEDSILKEPTINTIDKISSNNLDVIYELLQRNEEFSKYYDKLEEPKKKVLAPKK